MLTLIHASFATVEQLFRFKRQGFELPPFPGYTPDQWGIKAHNRPWIEAAGQFQPGQRIIEVGGAYSLLPQYLGDKYRLEPWVGDDFGRSSGDPLWSRWGDPQALPERYPSVRYVFQPFGVFSREYPDAYFDRVFSVSTLEHIPKGAIVDVFRDMHRCLRPGGLQLHTIDVASSLKVALADLALGGSARLAGRALRLVEGVQSWFHILERSGVKIAARPPSWRRLLDRATLVESPDVVYRFYEPRDAPKPYRPGASLLLIIADR